MQTRMTEAVKARLVNALVQLEPPPPETTVACNAFQRRAIRQQDGMLARTPFQRMDDCRDALNKLDKIGWYRSYHQRIFHEDFLKACTRIFWKTYDPGQFARDHHKILIKNGWDHLSQEILISTPRRFGKTISVSMFAAALIVSCPRVEVSVYSTCKRISQKLLRNIQKFIYLICDQDLSSYELSIVRQNMEEVVIKGPDGSEDVRIVNSYPSKVFRIFLFVPKSPSKVSLPSSPKVYQKSLSSPPQKSLKSLSPLLLKSPSKVSLLILR